MRSVFLIREKNTNTWCSSSKHSAFADDFDFAVIFLNGPNAEKAVKEMIRGLNPKYSTFPAWSLRDVTVAGSQEGLDKFIEWNNTGQNWLPSLVIPDFEVVEFNLVEC